MQEKEPQYAPVSSLMIISGPDMHYSKSKIYFLKPEVRQSHTMECSLTSTLYIGLFFQIPEKKCDLEMCFCYC